MNYPALAGGTSCFILLPNGSESTGSSVRIHRLSYTYKILLLHGKFRNVDRCVNVSIKDGVTIRARPFSIREFQTPIDVSAAVTTKLCQLATYESVLLPS
mgnify:CR=1 FL=1